MFGVTPCELMCFDDRFDFSKESEEENVIEPVQDLFSKDVVQLLQCFNGLNENGKKKAIEIVGDLVDHPKYTKQTLSSHKFSKKT